MKKIKKKKTKWKTSILKACLMRSNVHIVIYDETL